MAQPARNKSNDLNGVLDETERNSKINRLGEITNSIVKGGDNLKVPSDNVSSKKSNSILTGYDVSFKTEFCQFQLMCGYFYYRRQQIPDPIRKLLPIMKSLTFHPVSGNITFASNFYILYSVV